MKYVFEIQTLEAWSFLHFRLGFAETLTLISHNVFILSSQIDRIFFLDGDTQYGHEFTPIFLSPIFLPLIGLFQLFSYFEIEI